MLTRVLSIFRKDARRLWPNIAAIPALLAASAWLDPAYARTVSPAFSLISSLLPVACWLLIITSIHQEKLTGDRQYWLTRPISWKELLAAKALFVAVFINLPVFLCHIVVLAATGVPLGEHFPALLWRQLFFTAFYLLPAAALAAISRNLGEVILTGLAVAVPAVLLQNFLVARLRVRPEESAWTLTAMVAAIVIVGVATLLAIQYSRRQTRLARAVLVAVAAASIGVTWLPARATPRSAEMRISLDSRKGRPVVHAAGGPQTRALEFPVRVTGLPPGADVVKSAMTLHLLTARGRNVHVPRAEGGLQEVIDGQGWLTTSLERTVLRTLEKDVVDLSGTLEFTLFAQTGVMPVPRDHAVVVPRVGACTHERDAAGSISIVCLTPFPRASLYLGKPGRGANWIVPRGFVGGAVPTASGFQPVTRFSTQLPFSRWEDIGDAQLIAGQALARLRVPFNLRGIRLADYTPEP